MKSYISDAALFYKPVGEQLIGFCSPYVDDTLHAGNDDYAKVCYKTGEICNWKNLEWDDIPFSGLQIVTSDNGYNIHHKRYVSKLQELQKDEIYPDFISLRAKLTWTKNSRPYIAFSVPNIVQFKGETYMNDKNRYINAINNIIMHL